MEKNPLSNRVKALYYSQTIAMADKVRKLKKQGYNVINLSIGEPNLCPPNFVLDAAKKAINDGYHYYTPVSGFLDLKKTICKKFKRDNNILYEPSQIVISTGAKQSIMNVLLSILNKNDEVLIPSPYWVSYIQMIKFCDGNPVIIPTSIENNFKISSINLEKLITSKTRLLILNSPCNPTGSIYSYQELKELSEILKKFPNIMILSDEIYEQIHYDDISPISIASFPDIYHQVITLNGLSKSFSMTGWRIGYIGAPKWLSKSCEKIQGQMTSCTNSIAQKAAIAALDALPIKIKYMIDILKQRRDLIINFMKEIPEFQFINPHGTFYVFPNISKFFKRKLCGKTIKNSDQFADFLLDKVNIATISGKAFGMNNYLRISYATSEGSLKEAFKRIKNII